MYSLYDPHFLMWCAQSIVELVYEPHCLSLMIFLSSNNVQIASVKFLYMAIEVFHPGVMKDPWQTVFLLQASNFCTPGK